MGRVALVVALGLGGCQGPPATAIDPADAAPPAADARVGCDVLAQDCGAEAMCVWQGDGRTGCVASLGLPRYHVCLDSSQCSAGDGCHLDDFVDFYCVAYCDYTTYAGERDPGRCQVGEICGELEGPIGRCLGICEPLSSNCPEETACYLIQGGGADLCFPIRGDAPPGTACDRDNECAPGSGCLGSPRACAVYCDHENYPDEPEPRCEDAEVCRALDDDAVGACGPPA